MKKLLIVIYTLFLFALLYPVACDDDNPVKQSEPTGYNVFFHDYRYPQKCFIYNTVRQSIDSLYLPVNPVWDITISADGKYLYVPSEKKVSVVKLNGAGILTELPYDSIYEIAVSPDGEKVALQGNELYLLKTATYEVIYHDTVKTMDGHFSSNSQNFYFAGSGGWPSQAYMINLNTFEIISKDFSSDSYDAFVGRVVPSIDESLWFVYYSVPPFPNENYRFVVYDPVEDQNIYIDIQRPGHGNIEISPDGKYVFYTNPGGILTQQYPPPNSFKVYDIENNTLFKEISTLLTFNETDTIYFPTEEICVTPDSKWLVALSWGFDEIIVVNLETMEIEKQIALGGTRSLSSLSCQSNQ